MRCSALADIIGIKIDEGVPENACIFGVNDMSPIFMKFLIVLNLSPRLKGKTNSTYTAGIKNDSRRITKQANLTYTAERKKDERKFS